MFPPHCHRKSAAPILSFLIVCCVASDLPAGKAPNIILLVSDDQRPDTIHALGNQHIRTPHLDRLVQSGIAWTRATCANPICTPSRAEILTGCSGFRCGVMDFGKPINPTLPTMAKWFSAAGYESVYAGKWHNDGKPAIRGYSSSNGLYRGGGGRFAQPQFDFAARPVTGYRGWIFQDDGGTLFPEYGVGLTADISRTFADAAIEIIEKPRQKPLFLHVNFTAPHDPLLIPPGWKDAYRPDRLPVPRNFLPQHPFEHGNFDGRDEKLFRWPRTPDEVRRELAAYYAVISHLDQQVGRILSCLEKSGQRDNTILVYTSDHGLAMGSHGLRGKQNMYEHTIGVPLLIAGPGIPHGERVSAQCYLRDIFPTLCDLAGIPAPGNDIDGRSLAPIIRRQRDQVHGFVVGYFRRHQRMIRTDRWKYIEYPQAKRAQLFDLKADPHELQNLVSTEQHSAEVANLSEKMRAWFRKQRDSVYAGE